MRPAGLPAPEPQTGPSVRAHRTVRCRAGADVLGREYGLAWDYVCRSGLGDEWQSVGAAEALLMFEALSVLQGSVRQERGTWFWLRDEDTQFSNAPDRVRHPFVLPEGFNPSGRRAFAHGLPRSSTEPRSGRTGTDFLPHDPHGLCDGKQCDLDRQGWIKPLRHQVTSAWLAAGAFICVESNPQVLARIEIFEMNEARSV